jgi:hypothetical protein
MMELVEEGLFDKNVSFEVLNRKTLMTTIQQIKGEKKILRTGKPILDDKGEIIFVVTNDRDITELDNLRSHFQKIQVLAKEYISACSILLL